VGSASIGQAHTARTLAGEEVCVKVQVRAQRPPAGCAARTAALCWLGVVTARAQYPDARWQFMADIQVRKTPSWPRSWANFSLLCLYSRRNAWANLRLLGQPNTFLARSACTR
jgi:hypothetical protein